MSPDFSGEGKKDNITDLNESLPCPQPNAGTLCLFVYSDADLAQPKAVTINPMAKQLLSWPASWGAEKEILRIKWHKLIPGGGEFLGVCSEALTSEQKFTEK